MLQYVNKVVILYVASVRDTLRLSQCHQKVVVLSDVYRTHQGEKLIAKLKDNRIITLFILAACTDKLQSLDFNINYDYKKVLTGHNWHVQQGDGGSDGM